MKKIIITLSVLLGVLTVNAAGVNDTTAVTTLSDIIAMESQSKINNDNSTRLRSIWDKNTFFNISYNTTKLSSDEFPLEIGKTPYEFKNKLGVGIQWGQTFNFHKKPLGSVVFIGLDYTWMDLNFNQYDHVSIAVPPVDGTTEGTISDDGTAEGTISDEAPTINLDGDVLPMPWNQKKMSLNYGMSIGPSLTLYPFAPLHRNGTDKIRLQFYFHVGYSIGGTMIKEVIDRTGEKKDKLAWGHGLFTSYGANLTWNAIGVGYEWRNDNNINYKHVNKEFGTNKMKFKEKTSRVYLQFRF